MDSEKTAVLSAEAAEAGEIHWRIPENVRGAAREGAPIGGIGKRLVGSIVYAADS